MVAIEGKITGRFDNNNVQVELGAPKSKNKRYFEVPEDKAQSFIESYQKHERKTSILTNTAFAGSILGGIILGSVATKGIKNTGIKWALNIASGITGAVLSFIGCNNYVEKQNQKLMKQHQAKELDYSA